MQQTTKYKFNLIETSDAFSPEKLNENAETAERELAAEAAARAAGETAIRAEFAAADRTLSQTISSNKSSLQSTITAVEKGANLVHLAGPYESGGTGNVTVDLSRLNLSQYRALLIFSYVGSSGSLVIDTRFVCPTECLGGNVSWLFHFGDQTCCVTQYASTGYGYGGKGETKQVNWNSMKELVLYNGIYCDIYAIKA